MGNEIIHVIINDEVIDEVIRTRDTFDIVKPMWGVNIYNDAESYEKDISAFSRSQQYLYAIEWYDAEVCNGGHHQFYLNSAGIVWEEVLNRFEAIKAFENYNIIKETVEKFKGNPSKVRSERITQLEKYSLDFDSLDDRYYASRDRMFEMLYLYVKKHAHDFYFEGDVNLPE